MEDILKSPAECSCGATVRYLQHDVVKRKDIFTVEIKFVVIGKLSCTYDKHTET